MSDPSNPARAGGRRRIPLLARFHELAPAPRKFLAFSLFNVVSWQCIVGPVLILLARKIEMPPSWVGCLISFMPLSMVLVVLTVSLMTHLGPKRLMFWGWLSRNLIMCSVFAMPWAMAHWGPRSGWYVLMGAVLGFCVVRALGASAWFPWLHEVVPKAQRGAFFSTETGMVQLVSIAVLFVQGLILMGDPHLGRFLAVYGIGVGAGLISLVWMLRVPGGLRAATVTETDTGIRRYRPVLNDRAFLRFVLTASLSFSCISWLASSVVLYLREILHLSSREIMLYMTAGSIGVLLTIGPWSRFADHSGSGRAMFKTLTGHALVALLYLGLFPGAWWTPYALVPALMLSSSFSAAFYTSAHRAMLNYTKASARAVYSSVWFIGTSIAVGTTPILAGVIIDAWGFWGFRLCFSLAGAAGLAAALVCRSVVRDGAPIDPSTESLLNPTLPLRTLARIAWITLGLHESSRAERE
ncbi:MAG: MFS transporter [Candidatus Hydrogenedentes bacterium]|nr:MFS transporter [Candidatus Hydrogenedentota bacterium]